MSPDAARGSDEPVDLVARLAVLGRLAMLPSIKPVRVNGYDMLVQHTYTPKVEDVQHGFEIDVADCTFFTVHHKDRWKALDLEKASTALDVLDDSLAAVSEVLLWERANERIGKSSPFQRRVGRVDAKFFSIDGRDATIVAWRNPLYFTDLAGMTAMSSFLGNVVMTNGPAASPLPPDAKRLMSSIDLVNLGFFTEALITVFSLLDDLTQRVVSGGLAAKGFSDKDRRHMMLAIKEERLDHFLNGLTKLCDWVALKDVDAELDKKLRVVNTLRNRVMHGDRELARDEALTAMATLIDVIVHLQSNPFGVPVTDIPPLRPANPELVRLPDPPEAATES